MGTVLAFGDVGPCGTDLATLRSPYKGTTADKLNDLRLSCGADSTSPEQVFRYELLPGATITIGQTENQFDSLHQLAYGGTCPGNKIVGKCTDNPDVGNLSWTNDTGNKETVYYTIDGVAGAKGKFTLAWTITMPLTDIPKTIRGDKCRQSWNYGGEACNSHCCNPDGDSRGLWCFTQSGSASSWGYCDVSQRDPYFRTNQYMGVAAVVVPPQPKGGSLSGGASVPGASKTSAAGTSSSTLLAFAISLGIALRL